MANNKIIYNGTTLIDLTGDTVKESDVAQGKTFHLASGAQATGTASSGSKTLILDVSATEPGAYEDKQVATVSGYDYISDILEAMPNVVARWELSGYNYNLFTPMQYKYSGQNDTLLFECSLNGWIYTLRYDPGDDKWYVNAPSPDKYLPYEDWDFEVDDGQGGTTTITKRVFCIDISQ